MPIQEHQRFDVGALEAYLRNHGFSGPLAVRQFKGGQSNPTYLIDDAGKHHVLRASPARRQSSSLRARSGARVRVIKALGQAGIPCRALIACARRERHRRAFYVMEYVEGRVLWDQSLPGMTPPERAAIYDEMNRVIAALHRVDYAAAGSRTTENRATISRADRALEQAVPASETERIEPMDALIAWLPENIPAGTKRRWCT